MGHATHEARRWLVDPVLLLRRTFVVLLGYAAAVLVASAATVGHLALPGLLPGASGSHGLLGDWLPMLAGGVMITAPSALPGFLAALAVGESSGRRDQLFFTLAGGLNAFVALRLSGFLGTGSLFDEGYFVFSCFGGGLAGGHAYWLVTERWRPAPAGMLRRAAGCSGVSAPAPSGSSEQRTRTRRRRDSQ